MAAADVRGTPALGNRGRLPASTVVASIARLPVE
jgi:hypothetical protein